MKNAAKSYLDSDAKESGKCAREAKNAVGKNGNYSAQLVSYSMQGSGPHNLSSFRTTCTGLCELSPLQ